MISIENIHKKYGKNNVLRGVNLLIKKGGIFAILGPNGSGKTTLIKSILGMVIPTEGSITIDKQFVQKAWRYRREISYLPQIANFPPNLTVTELFSMIKDLKNKPAQDHELIAYFKLQPYLYKKLGTLSGGTRQKVNLALTFMFESNIIILDEPTTGLDPIALISLKKWIQRERDNGKTILITSHIMNFVEEISDEIVFILEGKIYFRGTPTELKTQTKQPDFESAIADLLTHHHV